MASVKVEDRLWVRIKNNLKSEVWEVGVDKDEVYPDRTSVAVVAAANEFGTSTIPARSFMRTTVDEQRRIMAKETERDIGRTLDLKEKKGEVLSDTAEKLRDAIKKKIETLSSPANAARTIKQKGFNNPLIETRVMQNAIKAKRVKK